METQNMSLPKGDGDKAIVVIFNEDLTESKILPCTKDTVLGSMRELDLAPFALTIAAGKNGFSVSIRKNRYGSTGAILIIPTSKPLS